MIRVTDANRGRSREMGHGRGAAEGLGAALAEGQAIGVVGRGLLPTLPSHSRATTPNLPDAK